MTCKFLVSHQKEEGSLSSRKPLEEATALRCHQGCASEEGGSWQEGWCFRLHLFALSFLKRGQDMLRNVEPELSSLLMPLGPQSHQEAHLQESWSLPQGIQADVQAWNPHEQNGSQGRQLLRPSWAQTCFCRQDQRVHFPLSNAVFIYLPCCTGKCPQLWLMMLLFFPRLIDRGDSSWK